MVQGTSFSQVRLAQPTGRMVLAGDGGFKAAGSGSIGSRIVNVLKETFFKDTVRTENREAYRALREGWQTQHGGETAAVREFFDSRIASGERFDASARDKLLGLPALSYNLASAGEATRAIVENEIAAQARGAEKEANRDPVPGHDGVTMRAQFAMDLRRNMTLTIDGEPLTVDGRFVPDGSRLETGGDEGDTSNLAKVGGHLVAQFGADWTQAISDFAHQGLAVPGSVYPQIGLSMLDAKAHPDFESPFRLPSGEVANFQGADSRYAIHLSHTDDGAVRIQCDVGFNVGTRRRVEESGGDGNWSPAVASMSDDSSLLLSYSFELRRDEATGRIVPSNASPILFAAQLRPRADI